jgi:hypothetical protein
MAAEVESYQKHKGETSLQTLNATNRASSTRPSIKAFKAVILQEFRQ